MQWFKRFSPMIISVVIALCGVIVLRFFHAPMPWLLGSILAIILAGRFRSLPLASPKQFSAPSRAILGITIGSAFKPEILHYIVDFFSSPVLILLFVLIIRICGMWY